MSILKPSIRQPSDRHSSSNKLVTSTDQDLINFNHHRVGDLVIAEQIVPCQKCRFCLIGQYQMCPDHLLFGYHQKSPGAMASYMVFPEKARVHKVRIYVVTCKSK